MEILNAEIKERIEMINKGEVPEGYKKTKVGIIPEDWDVKRLGELGEFFRGKGIPKSRVLTEGIGCITYGEIYTTYNYNFKNFKSYINEKTAKNSVPIKKNDILFAGSGETLKEIGKCVAYLGEEQAYAGGDIVVFRPYDIDGEVLGYLLNHDIVNNQKYKLGQGHSVVHIYAKDLETILIPVIHEKEQKKIAQILSTWDQAIELKEKLIEEKKEQKKGLMQKLLTGEVRLAGFDGEWEEVRLGSLCNITTGKLDANAMCVDGKYKFFTCAKEIYLIDEYAFDTEALLISGNGANVGYIHYYNGKFNAYQRTYVLDNFKNSIHYTKYVLDKYLEEQIAREKCAGNTPYIRMSTLSDMNIKIPKSLQEQKAIAKILSTADKEIELLTQELEQLKLQKKGLMQLLLTGIIRVKS